MDKREHPCNKKKKRKRKKTSDIRRMMRGEKKVGGF